MSGDSRGLWLVWRCTKRTLVSEVWRFVEHGDPPSSHETRDDSFEVEGADQIEAVYDRGEPRMSFCEERRGDSTWLVVFMDAHILCPKCNSFHFNGTLRPGERHPQALGVDWAAEAERRRGVPEWTLKRCDSTFCANRAQEVLEYRVRMARLEAERAGRPCGRIDVGPIARGARAAKPASEKDRRHVYVIRADSFVKIGIAKNPTTRMREIQTGNPHKLEVIASWEVAKAEAHERALHAIYKAHRTQGEWFALPQPELDRLAAAGCLSSIVGDIQ